MTVYKAVEYLKKWQYGALFKPEKKFIDDLWEAVQGGENPSNEWLRENCGISPKQEHRVWQIGKRFLITKESKA